MVRDSVRCTQAYVVRTRRTRHRRSSGRREPAAMDAGVVRIVAAGVLAAQGIGHALGWMPAWGIAKFEGMSSHSCLVSGLAGDNAARLLAGAVFVVPTVGFVAAAVGLLTGQPWWRQAAVASATTSLLCTALF